MAGHAETFTTMTHEQFNWPYPKAILAKPSQPPMRTGIRIFEKRMDPDDCPCDVHGLQNNAKRYKALANEERYLRDRVARVNREMTKLVASTLDESCSMGDEVMMSIYQTDYERRDIPIGKYRTLMAAIDSPIGSPINPIVTNLKSGFRDPTRFRYSAIERPIVRPPKSIDVLRVPEPIVMWAEPFTGRSEYDDTISKSGLSNMKNRQQYLQPLPSSRRRWGDSNL